MRENNVGKINPELCIFTNILTHTTLFFFYNQPHFPVEPQVAIGSSQNEAQNCYEVANVFWRLWSEINKNWAK